MDFTKFSTKELKKMLKERRKQLLTMTYVENVDALHSEIEFMEAVIDSREKMNG